MGKKKAQERRDIELRKEVAEPEEKHMEEGADKSSLGKKKMQEGKREEFKKEPAEPEEKQEKEEADKHGESKNFDATLEMDSGFDRNRMWTRKNESWNSSSDSTEGWLGSQRGCWKSDWKRQKQEECKDAQWDRDGGRGTGNRYTQAWEWPKKVWPKFENHVNAGTKVTVPDMTEEGEEFLEMPEDKESRLAREEAKRLLTRAAEIEETSAARV